MRRDARRVRTQAAALVQAGAVIPWVSPRASYLVDELRWPGKRTHCLAFFAVNGDQKADAYLWRFDRVEAAAHGMEFFSGNQRVGALAPIEHAPVDDPGTTASAGKSGSTSRPCTVPSSDKRFPTEKTVVSRPRHFCLPFTLTRA